MKKVTSKQDTSLVIYFWFAIKKGGGFKSNRIGILGDIAMFTYYNWLKRLLKKHKVKDKMGQRNLKLNSFLF